MFAVALALFNLMADEPPTEWLVINEPIGAHLTEVRWRAYCGAGDVTIRTIERGGQLELLNVLVKGTDVGERVLETLNGQIQGYSAAQIELESCSLSDDEFQTYHADVKLELTDNEGGEPVIVRISLQQSDRVQTVNLDGYNRSNIPEPSP